MKKKAIIFQCLVLILAAAIFMGYRMYTGMVTDSKGPEILIPEEDLVISVKDPESVLLDGVTARDNRDGDVTDSLIVEKIYGLGEGNHIAVTYAAFDKSGNVSKATRQVCYEDYHSPVFTLSRSLAFAGNIDILDYVGAEDVFDGDVQRRIRATIVSNNGSLSTIGKHEIEFRVYNSIGDTVKLVLPVEVYSADKYNGKLELKEYIVYLDSHDTFRPESYLSTFSHSGRDISLSGSIPDDVSMKINGSVNTSQPGVYPVTYTATRIVGQMIYTGYTMLIVVVE
ncbi:MAG: hypothetical protein IKJ99_02405 [Oscillospiraceae bacterium]|nr:hypothetical protein [Oscillospiraceae bacterium]